MQDGKLHKDIGIRLCYLHIDIYRGEMYNKLTRRCCYWAEKIATRALSVTKIKLMIRCLFVFQRVRKISSRHTQKPTARA
nr:MAG TPA: hypothetical protein [Caudoviricetes sp.]